MKKTGLEITVARKSGVASLTKRIAGLTKTSALLGVPANGVKRRDQLIEMAGKTKSKRKQERIKQAAKQDVTNAELLFIHTKGSPARGIPARPVLEPAVEADGNKQAIAHELASASKAALEGNKNEQLKRVGRAGMAGQNAARKWFTDPRNGWEQNTPATIAEKGSDKPLIDTGALRAAITYVVQEE